MKKLIALTALVCSASFAKAQYATFRITDNTGYAGGVTCQVTGDRFPGRACAPDNITEPPALISTSTYTVYTPGSASWAYPGATVLNGFIFMKSDGMGGREAIATGITAMCGIPPTGLSIMTNFTTTMDPVTITVTPVGATQLDIVLTP